MNKLTKAQRDELDRDVLRAMCERGRSATYVYRNWLDRTKSQYRGMPTSYVLRACRRLQSRGLAKEVASPYVVMICWQATELGAIKLAENSHG